MPFETTADLLSDAQLEAALLVALGAAPALVEQITDLLTPADFTVAEHGAAFAAALHHP